MSRLVRCVRCRVGSQRERGSATLELAILAPAVIVLLGLVVLAGRVQVAAGAVEHAASAAAREASLARAPAAAHAAATSAAYRELDSQDLRCAPSSVVVDTTGFAADVGQPAIVTATVTCTVAFGDLAVPAIPGSRTLRAEATSALDQWRSTR
ncbi:TadE/TadG family type IV pilus assembly protein [Cellulomonas fimi]|uniref:Pilus assembly protein n=1 Tax=Cellulomonas fimi TaxID=1708 RepID=A0A7Y0LWK7_CELFI|nr:TadE/TadG family type IV pilus assembly protein [Cellulomonas fimi]NMR19221.1 pilus assembly protein [Cellulomonas fimi]